jgi:hypothetical protein
MSRMRFAAAIPKASRWISIVVSVICRFWLHHDDRARSRSNLQQLRLRAVAIPIASRTSAHPIRIDTTITSPRLLPECIDAFQKSTQAAAFFC